MPAITVEEVQHALQHNFKGNVSSGLCAIPSQLFKHMRGDSLVPLTALINKCIIEETPPTSLKLTKLVPLFKGKGSEGNCNNYRGLAVMHPFTKLIMCILNNKLTNISNE